MLDFSIVRTNSNHTIVRIKNMYFIDNQAGTVDTIEYYISNSYSGYVQKSLSSAVNMMRSKANVPDHMLISGDSLVLTSAILVNDVELVEHLVLNKNMDVTAHNNKAIKLAVGSCSLNIIKILIDAGADITVDDNILITGIINNKDYQLLEYILINIKNLDLTVNNNHALKLAIRNNDLISTSAIVSHVGSENIVVDDYFEEVLRIAIIDDRYDIIKYLAENDIKINEEFLKRYGTSKALYDKYAKYTR